MIEENNENTIKSYLGFEFQQRLMWQLLVEPEFAEKILPNLSADYFDDIVFKKLFIFMCNFRDEYGKIPNLQNQSIQQAIHKYKSPNNKIEEETLFSALNKIKMWNERVLNKELVHDGETVQRLANEFIKQQEYRKLGEFIIANTKNGGIKNNKIIGDIEERILKITSIGEDEDFGTEVIENVEFALRKEFRQTIPTGIEGLDSVTGGGLGKGEMSIILAPSGVGKSTLLTKIANSAYEQGKNVLQIIFEDTEDQIKRKHYSIWSKIPLNEIDDNNELVTEKVYDKISKLKGRGRLVIKRFSQEDTTMIDIRNWMVRYQKKFGYKFEILVLDYLDCVISHKRTNNSNEDELVVVKSFEALAADFNIPSWTAIQSNRSGFHAEFVGAFQTGGSIKRYQKAHLFMSVAKTKEQQEAGLATIQILKARFATDGQMFTDCIFNNNTMEIIIDSGSSTNPNIIKTSEKKHKLEDVNKQLNIISGNTKASFSELNMSNDDSTEFNDIMND